MSPTPRVASLVFSAQTKEIRKQQSEHRARTGRGKAWKNTWAHLHLQQMGIYSMCLSAAQVLYNVMLTFTAANLRYWPYRSYLEYFQFTDILTAVLHSLALYNSHTLKNMILQQSWAKAS